jgi:hypothetical protein
VDEVELGVFQVADSPVHQARRAAGGSAGEIIALDECDAESAHRGIAGNPAAGDSSPNY